MADISINKYRPVQHYDTLSDWWKAYNWQPVHPRMLPEDGYVVTYDTKPICAAFLYKTDSCIAWAEWIISDPTAERGAKDESLDMLLNHLWTKARQQGFTVLFTSTNMEKLKTRLSRVGFTQTDQNVTQFMRIS